MHYLKKIIPSFAKDTVNNIHAYLLFVSDFQKFRDLAKIKKRFQIIWKNRNPQLHDRTGVTGFDRHYVYHTAWAARKIVAIKPELHTDISSILYFSTMVSAFIPVEFYDYRPADIVLDNLKSKHADLTKLPFPNDSLKTLSCMHVVEHIGLGRYGDPIDPEGDLKAINELKRVVAPGGSLLFVVPIGKPLIQFNAHRIYSYRMIMNYFSNWELKEFALIPEREGGIIIGATEIEADKELYGCGCFWFVRK